LAENRIKDPAPQAREYNVVKNLVLSSVSTFSTFFLFILLSFLGRILGKADLGIFTTALSIATIFEMFTDFGLRDISVRNVSRNKDQTGRYIGNLLTWKVMLCIGVYAAMIIFINIAGYEPLTRRIVYLLTVSAFLKSLKYTFRIFFQAHDAFGLDTIMVLFERIALLAFGLAALFKWKAILPFALCFVAVRLVDFLLTLIVIHWKIHPVKLKFEFRFMRNLQVEAFPLGLFFVILTVFSYIDTVMLSLMRPMEDVGLYNAAFKVYEGVAIIPTVFWLVFLPRLSELFPVDRFRHGMLSARSIKYMFMTGFPVLIAGIFASDFLIRFFFQDQFAPAVITLQMLFFGLAFQYPNWMLNATLISMNKQRIMLILGVGGLVFKVVSNLFLIPVMGYNGSAIATVASEFLIFLGAVLVLSRQKIHLSVIEIWVKPFAAALIMAGLLYLLPLPLAVRLAVAAAAYLAGLFAIGGFSAQEQAVFRKNLAGMLKGLHGKKTGE
jgi:O-antigen/teichoic acid export membrane protein